MSKWPFHIKPRSGPLNVPMPGSALPWILAAIALITISAVALH